MGCFRYFPAPARDFNEGSERELYRAPLYVTKPATKMAPYPCLSRGGVRSGRNGTR
ncbi:hypothetical protein AGR4C_Cc120283 [Agrobacterium tumefaciens str. Kerr 14]|uniref:Uncharacterized protein n=1 Tax=Agrobacterium tumefaciens str. Kerr 14 TaxID=1183424 RepID=A0A1S7NUT3_AGRTU|nr:hypothetical protein AGR4C_Cc120283 [Agrobacterium tumefaciens str. Kerr 14]